MIKKISLFSYFQGPSATQTILAQQVTTAHRGDG